MVDILLGKIGNSKDRSETWLSCLDWNVYVGVVGGMNGQLELVEMMDSRV